jgi:hypothetical protein
MRFAISLLVVLGLAAACGTSAGRTACVRRAFGLPAGTPGDAAGLDAALRARFPAGTPVAALQAALAGDTARRPACRFETSVQPTDAPGVAVGAASLDGADLPSVEFAFDPAGRLVDAPRVRLSP